MITSSQIILYPLVVALSCEPNNSFDHYKPHTVSSMIDSNNLEFYENFWSSLIKENCDSNSMVE